MLSKMNVDEILRQIGEFGVYQKVIFVIINILGITTGIRMLFAVFLIHNPPHRLVSVCLCGHSVTQVSFCLSV